MKIMRPVLLAAALLSPLATAAQTPRPDRSVDTDGTNPAEERAPTERAGTTGAARNEPSDAGSREAVPEARRHDDTSMFEKSREQLRTDIADLKRQVESLRGNTTERGREKLDALSTRIDELETRTVAAGEGTERDFNENKHKFTNEVKKIRRELQGVGKYRTMTPEEAPSAP